MSNMPLVDPFVTRPRLGSRFFIRGHIRKMWLAIFREIQDISVENRVRAAKLSLIGVIYTENYMTNHLDKFIPPFITVLGSNRQEDAEVCQVAGQIFHYLGRYCEYSAYSHIIKAALKGECVQHPEFVRCSFKALARLTSGNLECVPEGTGLCHKKKDVYDLMNLITELELDKEVNSENCEAVEDFVASLITGVQKHALEAEQAEIFGTYFAEIVKLLLIINYERNLVKHLPLSAKNSDINLSLVGRCDEFVCANLETYKENIREYLTEQMRSPPTYGEANWKCIVGYWLLLMRCSHPSAGDAVEVLTECIRYNHVPELVAALLKICAAILKDEHFERTGTPSLLSVLQACE